MIITCEQVSKGHPDKFCDQIADEIVNLLQVNSGEGYRAGIEVLAKDNTIVVAGEYRSVFELTDDHIRGVVETVIDRIGRSRTDFDLDNLEIINRLGKQSADIAMGVDVGGAGDQGMMYGYATNETTEMLPLPFAIATAFLRELDALNDPRLRADAKAQVSYDYEEHRITTFLCSVQHRDDVSVEEVAGIVEPLMHKVAEAFDEDGAFDVLVNPTGKFVIGGTFGDCGVTGRKLACDTYGSIGRIGGGAMSGKDPTKVDRSGAYMMRKIAKDLVRNGYCDKCEVQVAYAIGVADPVSVNVECFGTQHVSDDEIWAFIDKYDFTPAGIIRYLGLDRVDFRKTATYGHFGKAGLPWED